MTPVTINIPVAIVFEQVGATLRVKPFPSFPSFTDIYIGTDVEADLTLINASLADHESRITDVEAAVIAAQSDATTALANAATALSAANEADDTADAAQATADAALAAAGGIVYPSFYTLHPNQFHTISGGFGGANYNTTIWFDAYWLMNGLNAEADITLMLAAGTYKITMLWTKGAANGDLTLKVDGSTVATAVGYNATNLNAEFTWTTAALAAGEHTINIKTNAKQGASSGYQIVASLFTVCPV